MRKTAGILGVLGLGLLLMAQAWAASRVDPAELVPSPEHRRGVAIITQFMSNYHYSKVEIDDELSREVFRRYLDALDPSRSYFTARDMEALSQYESLLDDALRDTNLDPPFEIFRRYRELVEARVARAMELLEEGADYTIPEEYVFDRSDQPWVEDEAAMDDLWRRRVKNDMLGLRLAARDGDDMRETLGRRYERMERRVAQLGPDDVFQLFMNAYTSAVEPHTAYFSPRTSENFRIRMSLSLEGIGAALQTENEYTVVRRIIPGGPADLDGELKVEDRIVGVAQGDGGEMVDVVGWRLEDVVDLIRGPKGTVVRLELLPQGVGPEGPYRTVELTRNKVNLEEQAARRSLIEVPAESRALRVGVIEVPTFYLDFAARSRGQADYRSTTRDVRQLLSELDRDGIDALIVDLRGNGGGSLMEATELTGLFIDSGPVVQTRDASGWVEVNMDRSNRVAYAGPMAVLVDRFSASASEIFAGALQDYGRAVVIGEPTFGKGTVQHLLDLDRFGSGRSLGQLKLTVQQFFRVNGDSTQHRGVIPDIVYPLAYDVDSHGERAFDNALPWKTVPPADYKPVDRLGPTLPLLRKRHADRLEANPAFAVLLDEVRVQREAASRTSISLVEAERRREMDSTEAQRRAHEERLRDARGIDPLDAEPISEDEQTAFDAMLGDLLLEEAAHIVADLVDLVARPESLQASGDRASSAVIQ